MYDRNFWEERWLQALRERGERIAERPPNAHLTVEVGDLPPGRALDAGCGHGSDTLWLVARGWQVTAVDFAPTALAYARSRAETMGPDVAERIDWVEADLATHRSAHGRGRPGAGLRRGRARALEPGRWQAVVAEDRPRPLARTGVDAVIRARRRS